VFVVIRIPSAVSSVSLLIDLRFVTADLTTVRKLHTASILYL